MSCEDHDLHSDLSIHSERSESVSQGIPSGNDGGCDGIDQNIQHSNTTDSFDYGDDASFQGLADHEIEFF